MHPLKLVCWQIRPSELELQLLVNGLPYAPIKQNEPRYICVELGVDQVSIESRMNDEQVDIWRIDAQTLSDAKAQPQELAICPDDKLIIRFRLNSLKSRNRVVEATETSQSIERITETISEIHESTIQAQTNQKQEASSSAIFVREKQSAEPSTVEPDTIQERSRTKPQSIILDDLALERQRIISELFNKLKVDRKATVS